MIIVFAIHYSCSHDHVVILGLLKTFEMLVKNKFENGFEVREKKENRKENLEKYFSLRSPPIRPKACCRPASSLC